MKGLRTFLALLVVAAALGAFLYYDAKRPPADDKKAERVFAGLQPEQIEQITIKGASGEQSAVQKQGAAWQVTAPVTAPADEAELSGITSSLASLEVQRVIDEQASDFKEFGLEPARIQVTFKAAGKDHTLLLGQKTPTGADMYARLPERPRVFLLSSYLESTFNKTPFDLRDKTILKVDRDKIDRIDIENSNGTVALAKQGADWRIAKPFDARADFGAIEGILGRLNSTPMKSIAPGDAGDAKAMKEYGLDAPVATIRMSSGSAQAGLAIGKPSGEGAVYARDLSRPLVFTIDSGFADDLKKPADEFRVKDLFDARAFNTTRVEISRQGQTATFEKDKDNWKQTAPAAKAVDAAKVEGLLSALSNTRASGFESKIAATGLETPELAVALAFEDGQKHEKVSFARKGPDAFARREGESAAAKIDTATLDGIIKALDALK